jgi:hypothetical protein
MRQILDFLTAVFHHFKAVRYRWWVLLHDLVVVGVAWIGAYWLRAPTGGFGASPRSPT